MKNAPIPIKEFPKILWYQEKRPNYTPEEIKKVFNNYFNILLTNLKKQHPSGIMKDIYDIAKNKAEDYTKKEINKPAFLRKTVVNTVKEEKLVKEMIENTDTFIQWYKK